MQTSIELPSQESIELRHMLCVACGGEYTHHQLGRLLAREKPNLAQSPSRLSVVPGRSRMASTDRLAVVRVR